eukprot:1189307-Prorocentrum_minimum.AAC.1
MNVRAIGSRCVRCPSYIRGPPYYVLPSPRRTAYVAAGREAVAFRDAAQKREQQLEQRLKAQAEEVRLSGLDTRQYGVRKESARESNSRVVRWLIKVLTVGSTVSVSSPSRK